jgi:glycolate oxidase iron-sulfur subunit
VNGPRQDGRLLEEVAEAVERCNRCGTCLADCPTYVEARTESAVARGRVQLAAGILNGEIAPDREAAAVFASCTTCMACEAVCPSGVRVARIVEAARAAIVREHGLPWLQTAVFGAVKRPRLHATAAEAAARMQGVLFSGSGDGLRRPRIPYGLASRRAYPPLAGRPFGREPSGSRREGSVSGASRAAWASGPRVLFFPGCMVTYVYPEIGRAAVRLLERAGATVVTPPVAACCGTPLEAGGDAAGAAELARFQLDQLDGVSFDAVVSACPTCAGSFIHRYPRLLAGESRYAARAERVAARTHEVTQYLADVAGISPSGLLDVRVTYHDPCHLGRGLGVETQPRRLLGAVPGVRVVEMRQPARCCGGAGSFSVTHPGLSVAIGERKAEDILATGAEVVATACPGCRLQLADVLCRAAGERPVAHVVELLDLAAHGTGG